MLSLKNKLLNNLKNTYCRLKASKHGVGVFAERDIPKNTDPFMGCKRARWLKFSEKELVVLPKEVLKMVKDFYGSYGKYYLIPYHGLNGNDISFYLNHSENPNVFSTDKGENFLTSKKIKEGEELLADYKTFDPKDEIFTKKRNS